MIITNNKYNFAQAIEVSKMKIEAGYRSFEIETEFGCVFVDVIREHWKDIYRYDTAAWTDAPIKRSTEYAIRRRDISHYIGIENVHNERIMGLMLTMALAECLMRYITGQKNISQEDANFIACSFLHSSYCFTSIASTANEIAEEYQKTMKSRGLFRSKVDDGTKRFLCEFFKRIMEDYTSTAKKNKANFSERNGQTQFVDRFYQDIVEHLFRKNRFSKQTAESEFSTRWRKVAAINGDDVPVYTNPDAVRFVLNLAKD